jgi:hypothetical protein
MSLASGELKCQTKIFRKDRSELQDRWDPNYYRWMAEYRNRMKNCPFPIQPLKQSLARVQYGISERATEEPIGVPMLRMINLQDDTWDLSDLKYIHMTEREKKPYLLRTGDILFNRTNSKELVGSPAKGLADGTKRYRSQGSQGHYWSVERAACGCIYSLPQD